MKEMYQYLEKYQGKTIEEVISIEKELYFNKINDLKLKEELKQKTLKEILEHKYYKINFNGMGISYVKINSLNPIMSVEISTYIDDKSFQIKYDNSRKLNELWFLEPSNSATKIDKISEEQYLEMVDLYNSTKNLIKDTRL